VTQYRGIAFEEGDAPGGGGPIMAYSPQLEGGSAEGHPGTIGGEGRPEGGSTVDYGHRKFSRDEMCRRGTEDSSMRRWKMRRGLSRQNFSWACAATKASPCGASCGVPGSSSPSSLDPK